MAKTNKAIVQSLKSKLIECESRFASVNALLSRAQAQGPKESMQYQVCLLGSKIETLKSILGK